MSQKFSDSFESRAEHRLVHRAYVRHFAFSKSSIHLSFSSFNSSVEPLLRLRSELIFGKFRQLRGAEHGVVAHEKRRVDLGIAVLARVQVEHELSQRPFEPRQRSFQDDEPRAGELRRGLEIHQPERLAELEMLLRLKREFLRLADLTQNLVGAGIRRRPAHRQREYSGMIASSVLQLVVEPLLVRLARLDRGLEGCDLVHEALGSPLILLGLGVADLLWRRRCGGLARSCNF